MTPWCSPAQRQGIHGALHNRAHKGNRTMCGNLTSGHPSSEAQAPIPAVFLHGFLGTGEDWQGVRRRVAPWPTYAPDLPGHGTTPLCPGVQGYASWVTWLHGWLDAHALEQVHLVGYSLGGRVALAFALAHPQRVVSLTLESANPGIEEPRARAERARLDARRADAIRRQGLRTFLENWYRLPLFASLDAHPGLRKRLIIQRAQQKAANMARVIEELSPGVQPDLTPHLDTLKMPVLLIAGERDPKYPALLQRVASRIPHAQTRIIPHAGHNVHLEAEAAFSQALLDFWALAAA